MRRAKSLHRTKRTLKSRKFKCRAAGCSKCYVYRHSLRRHEQTRTPDRPPCSQCPLKLMFSALDDPKLAYTCDSPNCHHTFVRKNSYQRHLKTQHRERFNTAPEAPQKPRQYADESENKHFVRGGPEPGPGPQATWKEVPGAQTPGREDGIFTLPSGVPLVYMSCTDSKLLEGLALCQVEPLMDFVPYYFCRGGKDSHLAMQFSLNSLAMAILGRTPTHKWLQKYSQLLYIQALRFLSCAVRDEPGAWNTTTAAYGLAMFEVRLSLHTGQI